jgi:hypothetical protein
MDVVACRARPVHRLHRRVGEPAAVVSRHVSAAAERGSGYGQRDEAPDRKYIAEALGALRERNEQAECGAHACNEGVTDRRCCRHDFDDDEDTSSVHRALIPRRQTKHLLSVNVLRRFVWKTTM